MYRWPILIPALCASNANAQEISTRSVQGKAFFTSSCGNVERFRSRPDGAGDVAPEASLPSVAGMVGDIAGVGLKLLGDALQNAAQKRGYAVEATLSYSFFPLDEEGGGTSDDENDDGEGAAVGAEASPQFEGISVDQANATSEKEDGSAGGGVVPAVPISLGNGSSPLEESRAEPTVATGCINLVATTGHSNIPLSLIDTRPENFEKIVSAPPSEGVGDSRPSPSVDPLAFALEIALINHGDAVEVKPVHLNYMSRIGKFPTDGLPSEVQLTFSRPGKGEETTFAVVRIPMPKVRPGDTWWDYQLNDTGPRIPIRQRDGGVGSTNVSVRFVLIKDENKFLKEVGTFLSGKQAAATALVTSTITPELRWNTSMGEYQRAAVTVERAEADLETARTGADVAAIRAAEDALLNGKIGLNAAAAELGMQVPYPLKK